MGGARVVKPVVQKLASPDFLWSWTVRVHRFAGALSALLVLLGAAAWWFGSDLAASNEPTRTVAAARMMWLRDSDGTAAWRVDARTLSSPVLFALPTPLGFSRGALSAGGSRKSATYVPTNGVLQATPPASMVAEIPRTTPRDAAAAARALPLPAGEVEAGASPTPSSIVVVGQFSGALPLARVVPWGTNTAFADSQTWESVARVNLDEQGWPVRVLLEKSSQVTNRNQQIVRMLRTMNFGATGAREGRVTVRYEGNGGGAP